MNGAKPILENTENDLFGFMGDKINIVCPLNIKPTMQSIALEASSCHKNLNDIHIIEIQQKTTELYMQSVKEALIDEDIQLEYETVKEKGPKETVLLLAWFLLWLGRDIVKSDFIPDICFVFSRIWKVLSCENWGVKDLTNNVVVNQVYLECRLIVASLVYFKKKEYLLRDFIHKLCKFIGRTFE